MRSIYWILGFLASVVYLPSHAAVTGYPTDSELRTLPPYCHALIRGGSKSDEYKHWASIIGPGFGHGHHFCQGLNLINRYYAARTAYEKQYQLGASLPEFGYFITHATPTSSLMPEVYMNRGFALWKLGRVGEAIQDFEKAAQLNPKLARSYVYLGDLYEDKKLKQKALAAVTEGLKHVPDSKMLQRRYTELGGKKPFPEPYPAPASEPAAAAQAEAAPAQSQDPVPQTKDAAPSAAGSQEAAPAPSVPPPVIGIPGNPWCRFCPDPAPAKESAGTPAAPATNP